MFGLNSIAGIDINTLITAFFILSGVGLGLAVVLLVWVLWQVRRIHLPADADVITALRATPLAVVLLLDLLDFGLDFLSAPISWAILTRLGLGPLRGVTVVKDLIPFTQFIPALTGAWLFVRVFDQKRGIEHVSRPRIVEVDDWKVVDADGWRVVDPEDRRIARTGEQRRR